MIISKNSDPQKSEFDQLIQVTLIELNDQAKKFPKIISKLTGRSLEPFVKDLMTEMAFGTVFENSIELIGGQKFPDIVAKKYYGIEVKTTTQNHWRTTGNSVLENTRVDDVERIFMLFAKLSDPIEFRCRPYEDVLSEVVVTHSPRYLIDMNLEAGKTIFDKIKLPYDTLRKDENPIKPIIDYYKRKLKPGEDLWWMDTENVKSSNIVIRIWNNLDLNEKKELKNKAMVYFPELFGNNIDKFGRISIWLINHEGIVCPNIRDLFSAGGKIDYLVHDKLYKRIPRSISNLFDNIPVIVEIIKSTPATGLTEFWGVKTTEKSKLSDWIKLVSINANKINDIKILDIEKVIKAIIN